MPTVLNFDEIRKQATQPTGQTKVLTFEEIRGIQPEPPSMEPTFGQELLALPGGLPLFLNAVRQLRGGKSLPPKAYERAWRSAGGIAGGTVGMLAAHPVTGAIAGATIGGGLGDFASQELEKRIAPHMVPATPQERFDRTLKAAGIEGALELTSQGLIKILSPFGKKILPETEKVMKWFAAKGGKFTPGQATESYALDYLENVAESSIFGGARMAKFKAGQEVVVKNIADNLSDSIAKEMPAEEVGNLIKSAVDNKIDAFRVVGRGLYKKVDDLAGGAMINTKPLKIEAAKILKQMRPTVETITSEVPVESIILDETGKPFTELAEQISKTELMPSLKNRSTVKLLRDFQNLPDKVPFSYLQQWRSDLLQVGYQPSDLIPSRTAGTAKHFAKQIDDLFSQAEGGLSDEALVSLQRANQYWRAGKERFNSSLVKAVAAKNPEAVLGRFLKTGDITDIRAMKKIVGPEIWSNVQGAYVRNLLYGPEGIVTGKKLTTSLHNMGRPTLNELLGPEMTTELHNLANIIQLIEKRPTRIGGGMMIQLRQSGALMQLAGAITATQTQMPGLQTTGLGFLIGPEALAQLFTRPAGIRYFTKGLTTNATSAEAIRLAARITELATEVKTTTISETTLPTQVQKD